MWWGFATIGACSAADLGGPTYVNTSSLGFVHGRINGTALSFRGLIYFTKTLHYICGTSVNFATICKLYTFA
jgi:hypothetical protein